MQLCIHLWGFSLTEGRCRGVVRLELSPKAAYFEGRCRGVVRLELSPKAAYLERRCRGVACLEFSPKAAYHEGRCRGVVPFRVPTREDSLQRFARLGFTMAMFLWRCIHL